MIKEVSLVRFKRFASSKIQIHSSGVSFLAGGNNSGKSTFLQAIAVWDFCRSLLENERGRESLLRGYGGQGLGLSDDEFSPILVPSLKHLWTNLKSQIPKSDGYSLSVECIWDDGASIDKKLKISLALTNDRLFIKAIDSNLSATDTLPVVAYLPPFAGIASRENKMSGAERRGMIGRGLAGGIIRNLLLDMYEANLRERSALKGARSKIKTSDLKRLREIDPWEILQKTLGTLFNIQLEVDPFNDMFHSYIRVKCVKGKFVGATFKRYPNFKPRDIMAEGSGFLQWLSVYALALSPSNTVLLLDEPDSHLHPSLQSQLTEALENIAQKAGKQVLIATHSTEILRFADCSKILAFKGNSAKYLEDDAHKIGLFIGLGSDYAPKIDPLRHSKRMLIVENASDANLLKAMAHQLGLTWPRGLVIWPWTGQNKERKQLFIQLQQEIPELIAIGIRDRDDTPIATIDRDTLSDKSTTDRIDGLHLKVWRRRHIENYLLFPPAIARASGVTEGAIVTFMAEHALVVPSDFTSRTVAEAMLDARGKEIMVEDANSVKRVFGQSPLDVVSSMNPVDIPDDVKYLIDFIIDKCKT